MSAELKPDAGWNGQMVDRVLRRVREVLVIVALVLLIGGMLLAYFGALGAGLSRMGDPVLPSPTPSCPYGEGRCGY